MSDTATSAPKVFISYSQDSPEHKRHVFDFSNRLRSDGIDCMIDLYVMSPHQGWPLWMIDQIKIADFILMICTERYYKRAMGREQAGIGHGARWEANLLFNQFYDGNTLNAKIIPIFFDEKDHKYIPDPFLGISYYCPAIDTGYYDLYRLLTNQQFYLKADLGEIRKLPSLEPKGDSLTYEHERTLHGTHDPATGDSRESSVIPGQSPPSESRENLTDQGQLVDTNSNATAAPAVADTATGQQDDIITLANQYYTDIAAGSSIARAASRLFLRQKIYPDECSRLLSALRTISKPIQGLGKLATQNPTYFKQTRYDLLRALHLLEAELLDLETLKNAYCPGCPNASKELQQDIFHKLEEILMGLDAITRIKQSSAKSGNISEDEV